MNLRNNVSESSICLTFSNISSIYGKSQYFANFLRRHQAMLHVYFLEVHNKMLGYLQILNTCQILLLKYPTIYYVFALMARTFINLMHESFLSQFNLQMHFQYISCLCTRNVLLIVQQLFLFIAYVFSFLNVQTFFLLIIEWIFSACTMYFPNNTHLII